MDRWFVTTMNVCTVLKSTQTINLGGERTSITFALEYIILWKPAAIVFCSNTTRTKVEIYWIASFKKKYTRLWTNKTRIKVMKNKYPYFSWQVKRQLCCMPPTVHISTLYIPCHKSVTLLVIVIVIIKLSS